LRVKVRGNEYQPYLVEFIQGDLERKLGRDIEINVNRILVKEFEILLNFRGVQLQRESFFEKKFPPFPSRLSS